MSESIGSDFPNQQARCRQLVAEYRDLPNGVGMFAVMMIEDALARADRAWASGDIVAILRSYQELSECE